MTAVLKEPKKHLLEYLPAIYQEPEPSGAPSFLGRFLTAFERLLLDVDWRADNAEARDEGREIEDEPLERKIADLHLYFDAAETPEEFLSWLAGWAALSFHPELNLSKRRKLLARIIALYRIRGTRKGLEEILRVCLDAIPSVNDHELPAMQIGTHSTVGSDTCLGGEPPHFFRVQLVAPKLNAPELEVQRRLAVSLIEISKPAHTYYELEIISRQMQVGTHSTVGLDTILGPAAS
jgi:phage tail-like protein